MAARPRSPLSTTESPSPSTTPRRHAQFHWSSIVDDRRFRLATPEAAAATLPPFAEQFPDNPKWNTRDFVEGLANGSSDVWRIEPTQLAGRIHLDPERPQ